MAAIVDDHVEGTTRRGNPARKSRSVALVSCQHVDSDELVAGVCHARLIELRLPALRLRQQLGPDPDARPSAVPHVTAQPDLKKLAHGAARLRSQQRAVDGLVGMGRHLVAHRTLALDELDERLAPCRLGVLAQARLAQSHAR